MPQEQDHSSKDQENRSLVTRQPREVSLAAQYSIVPAEQREQTLNTQIIRYDDYGALSSGALADLVTIAEEERKQYRLPVVAELSHENLVQALISFTEDPKAGVIDTESPYAELTSAVAEIQELAEKPASATKSPDIDTRIDTSNELRQQLRDELTERLQDRSDNPTEAQQLEKSLSSLNESTIIAIMNETDTREALYLNRNSFPPELRFLISEEYEKYTQDDEDDKDTELEADDDGEEFKEEEEEEDDDDENDDK